MSMGGVLGQVMGMKVFPISEDISIFDVQKQVRFPKSNKKRIRKKWAKRPENFTTVKQRHTFVVGGNLYADDIVLEKMAMYVEELNNKN